MFFLNSARQLEVPIKDQSRPSISDVKSADIRLATGLGTATSPASVTNCV